MSLNVLACVLGAVTTILGGLYLFFRDRDKQRVHENKLTVEVAATAKELNEAVRALDDHTRTSLGNYKLTLVEVLKDMREVVKNTESERKRTAGVAAGTLLHPGKRMPAP